jgi:hypothetical protein
MNCTRCQGLLVEDWDVESRTKFLRCTGCSARPYQVTYRADGLPLGAPLLCTMCHKNPRAVMLNKTSKGEQEIGRCIECREAYNRRRYRWKYRGRKGRAAA